MRNATIIEVLGDGEYAFRLGYGQFLDLQEKTNIGPFALYRRFMADDWMVHDIFETIRLGLVGGGMKPADAYKHAKKYVMDEPPFDNLNLARMILVAGLHGAPDEDKDKSSDRATARDRVEDDKLSSRSYYGSGAIMGFTPQEINEMSLHQLKAAFDGYADYHAASNGQMTEEVKDELFELVLAEEDRIKGIA